MIFKLKGYNPRWSVLRVFVLLHESKKPDPHNPPFFGTFTGEGSPSLKGHTIALHYVIALLADEGMMNGRDAVGEEPSVPH